MIHVAGLRFSARRFNRALTGLSYVAVVVAAIAYAASLDVAHSGLAEDRRLQTFVQVGGAHTVSRDNARTDYGNVILGGWGRHASATWRIDASFMQTSASPGASASLFVMSPFLTFTRATGVASIAIGGRTVGTIRAAGPRRPDSNTFGVDIASTTIAIPPAADRGWRFEVPASLPCAKPCLLRADVSGGMWDIQRLGVMRFDDPGVGPPLWRTGALAFAAIAAFALAACGTSFALLTFVTRTKPRT